MYTAAKFIVSECVRTFVPAPTASVQWKPYGWLSFSDQLDPWQVDVVDACWTALNLPTQRIGGLESPKLHKYW